MPTARVLNRHDLVALVEGAGLRAEDIRGSYSGRGMNGRECFAVTLDNHRQAYGLFATMAEMLCNEDISPFPEFVAADLASIACVENMGLGLVLFFPGYTLTETSETTSV